MFVSDNRRRFLADAYPQVAGRLALATLRSLRAEQNEETVNSGFGQIQEGIVFVLLSEAEVAKVAAEKEMSSANEAWNALQGKNPTRAVEVAIFSKAAHAKEQAKEASEKLARFQTELVRLMEWEEAYVARQAKKTGTAG